MTTTTLKIISNVMELLGIEYGFIEYKHDPILYPYFVGEYQEYTQVTEDGLQEATFMLTGFSRSSWLELEEKKNLITDYFDYTGRTYVTNDGIGVAISYSSTMVIPTGNDELKKMQINLNVKEWRT